MPEVLFKVRWPDGAVETCYSPSTAITAYLEAGRSYGLADFVIACRAGLRAASERVRQRYGGGGCARALAQLAAIEAMAGRQDAAGTVLVETFISDSYAAQERA